MPPSRIGDTYIMEIALSPDVAALVHRLAQIQELTPDSPELPDFLRMRPDLRKLWKDTGTARLLIKKRGWKPMRGGLEFFITPHTKGKAGGRAVAIYQDPAWTVKLLSEERIQGSLILQEVEGIWYAHVRYHDPSRRTGWSKGYQTERQVKVRAAKTAARMPPKGESAGIT